jgi:acyl-CoA thioesterase
LRPYERPATGSVLEEDIWQTKSGLEVMEGTIAEELPAPPSNHLFGLRPTAASEGACTFVMPAHGWLASPTGFVEGGATAFLADCALGGAVQTTAPAGTAIAPTDLRVQFLRPVPTDGTTLTAVARVVHRGRGFAAARAEVTNEAGKLVALAGASALIQPGRRASLREDA